MRTLLVIDVQNDFCPGGPLEVKDGDAIIPVINKVQDGFELVVATQDWHPSNHKSFASNHNGMKPFEKTELNGLEQILWPDHCVQGSRGAEFHPNLHMNKVESIFRKGMDSEIDSYSGFYDNGHRKDTGLTGYLKARKADELYFCGLAADICVYFSIKDSLNEGFKTYLIEDATRPLSPGDFGKIKKELTEKGLTIVTSDSLM